MIRAMPAYALLVYVFLRCTSAVEVKVCRWFSVRIWHQALVYGMRKSRRVSLPVYTRA